MWRHPYRAFSTVVDEVMTSSNVLFEFHRGFSKTTDPNPPSFEATIADTRARPSKIRWDEKESRGRFVRVPVSIPTLDYETYFDYYQYSK